MAKYTNKSTGSAYGDKAKSDWERQQKKKGTSSYGTEEWRRSHEEDRFGPTTPDRGGKYGNKETNLGDRGYPSSTNQTSQPKTKKIIGTLEAKEKAKTRSAIEAAFVGNIKSAPPSKEEQERLRKQGSRNAANQYSKSYSTQANNYSRSNTGRGR